MLLPGPDLRRRAAPGRHAAEHRRQGLPHGSGAVRRPLLCRGRALRRPGQRALLPGAGAPLPRARRGDLLRTPRALLQGQVLPPRRALLQRTLLPGNRRCYRGRCRKCPPKTRKCGTRQCCEKGEECCDGRCCGKKQKCCGDHCCDKSDSCCGADCCSDKQKCCGDHCCDRGEDCCGGGCCPEGQTRGPPGARREDVLPVRPARPHALRGDLLPVRDIAAGDRCRPRSRPNCSECDPPCRAGESCRDGFCLEV